MSASATTSSRSRPRPTWRPRRHRCRHGLRRPPGRSIRRPHAWSWCRRRRLAPSSRSRRRLVRIGRLEELDLCISHRSISREHARDHPQGRRLRDRGPAERQRRSRQRQQREAQRLARVTWSSSARCASASSDRARPTPFDPAEEEQVAAAGLARTRTREAHGGGDRGHGRGGGRSAGVVGRGRQAGRRRVRAAGARDRPSEPVVSRPPKYAVAPPAERRGCPSQAGWQLLSKAAAPCSQRNTIDDALRAAQSGLVAAPATPISTRAASRRTKPCVPSRPTSRARRPWPRTSSTTPTSCLRAFRRVVPIGPSPTSHQTMQRAAMGRLTPGAQGPEEQSSRSPQTGELRAGHVRATSVMVDDANHILTVAALERRCGQRGGTATARPAAATPAPEERSRRRTRRRGREPRQVGPQLPGAGRPALCGTGPRRARREFAGARAADRNLPSTR